jgi:hypothetical protein
MSIEVSAPFIMRGGGFETPVVGEGRIFGFSSDVFDELATLVGGLNGLLRAAEMTERRCALDSACPFIPRLLVLGHEAAPVLPPLGFSEPVEAPLIKGFGGLAP